MYICVALESNSVVVSLAFYQGGGTRFEETGLVLRPVVGHVLDNNNNNNKNKNKKNYAIPQRLDGFVSFFLPGRRHAL